MSISDSKSNLQNTVPEFYGIKLIWHNIDAILSLPTMLVLLFVTRSGNKDNHSSCVSLTITGMFTVFYSALQCFTVLYSALQCFIVLYSALLYFTVLYCTLQYFTVLYSALQYFTVLYSALQCFTVLWKISGVFRTPKQGKL